MDSRNMGATNIRIRRFPFDKDEQGEAFEYCANTDDDRPIFHSGKRGKEPLSYPIRVYQKRTE
jgi:hypothetical protein